MSRVSMGRWWLTVASWVTIGWLAAHAIGVVMTLVFERQVGFFPVWFFDCIACTGSEFSMPYRPPRLILGVSIPGLLAGVAAVALVATRHRPIGRWAMLMGVGLLAFNGLHAAVTWAYRFPGSLPTIVASVVIPAIAAVMAAAGALGAPDRSPLPVSPVSLRDRLVGWGCLASGMVAVSLLGGAVALAAGGVCGWRVVATSSRRQRLFALAGLALAVVGMVIRIRIRMRFPDTLGLL